jgi:transcriptional regulator with XRE-family HTH domain
MSDPTNWPELSIGLWQEFSEELRRLRQAAGLTHQALASAIPCERSLVTRVENGHRPSERFVERCDDLLGARGSLRALYRRLKVDDQKQSETFRLLSVTKPDDVMIFFHGGRMYFMPTRRDFLRLASVSTLAAAVGSADGVIAATEALRRGGVSSLPSGVLGYVEGATEDHCCAFRRTPSAVLYPQVVGLRYYVDHLLEGKLKLSEHRNLVVSAGWLSALLGLICFELNDCAAAAVWCDDAEQRGREANHAELVAWPYDTRALMASYAGRGRDTVECSQAGQELAPAGSVVHAKLIAQEMRGWARLGAHSETEDALRRAERAMAKLPAGPPPTNVFGNFANRRFYLGLPPLTATSLLLLGEAERAERLVRQTIDLYNEPNPTSLALNYLDLARALIGLHELDEAYAAGVAALGSEGLAGSVIALAGEVDTAFQLDHGKEPQAQEFHEQYVVAYRSLAG